MKTTLTIALAALALMLAACTARDPFDDCYHKCKGASTPYPEGACIELCKKAEVTPTGGSPQAAPTVSAAALSEEEMPDDTGAGGAGGGW